MGLVQDDPDVSDALLQAVDGLFVWAADPAGFDGIDLVDEAVRLIRELADNLVPLGETLVAAAAVGEGSGVPTGTGVTAWTRDAFHADALTVAFVTLRLSDSASVAVTCWDRNRLRVRGVFCHTCSHTSCDVTTVHHCSEPCSF